MRAIGHPMWQWLIHFRLDFVSTKAGIKGGSVVMGYLETGMRVLRLPLLLFYRGCKNSAVLRCKQETNTTADSARR